MLHTVPLVRESAETQASKVPESLREADDGTARMAMARAMMIVKNTMFWILFFGFIV